MTPPASRQFRSPKALPWSGPRPGQAGAPAPNLTQETSLPPAKPELAYDNKAGTFTSPSELSVTFFPSFFLYSSS